MLLEDSAAAGVCVSGGPVHSYPYPQGLTFHTLSGSLPLPDQIPQRYTLVANQNCPTIMKERALNLGVKQNNKIWEFPGSVKDREIKHT